MRLILISLGTLTITLLIGLIIRLWGLSLPYKKFEHPYFDYTKTITQPASIVVFNKEHFETTVASADKKQTYSYKIAGQIPTLIWLNIYMTSDRHLVSDYNFNLDAFTTWARDKKKFKGKFAHNYSLNELNEFYSELLSLESVIDAFPSSKFVFNILSNETDIHKEIVKFIDTKKLSDRILINSPIDIVIKAVKEQKPMWVYGTSISEATRVKSFSTLSLESAISVRGDVFIAPVSYLNRPLIDESLVTEMKRRKKYVFIGPVKNEDERKVAEELKPDGIIF